MSDPATDPAHDLLDHPQDAELVRLPHVRLGTFLALLRALASERGDASVTWSAGGFIYSVDVVRTQDGPLAPSFDADPDAPQDVRALIVRALTEYERETS